MENYSTSPKVFLALYEAAPQNLRIKILPELTKRQIADLKTKGLLKYKDEIRLAKSLNPKGFPAKEISRDDWFYASLTQPNAIQKVKNLTKAEVDQWFEAHDDNVGHPYRWLNCQTCLTLLKSGHLSDDQITMLLDHPIDHGIKNEISLITEAAKLGIKLPIEAVSEYYFKNCQNMAVAESIIGNAELQDEIFTLWFHTKRTVKSASVVYSHWDLFNIFHSDLPMGLTTFEPKWQAIIDIFREFYPRQVNIDYTQTSVLNTLFDQTNECPELVERFAEAVRDGKLTLEFLKSLGLNMFPKSSEVLMSI